jgi:hypothetical protein
MEMSLKSARLGSVSNVEWAVSGTNDFYKVYTVVPEDEGCQLNFPKYLVPEADVQRRLVRTNELWVKVDNQSTGSISTIYTPSSYFVINQAEMPTSITPDSSKPRWSYYVFVLRVLPTSSSAVDGYAEAFVELSYSHSFDSSIEVLP